MWFLITTLELTPHSNCTAVQLQEYIQSDLQEECWCSVHRWCTLISVTITSVMIGQRVLQECWDSVHHWRTCISGPIESNLSGKGDYEFRGVVRYLDFVHRHLELLFLSSVYQTDDKKHRHIVHLQCGSLGSCALTFT